MMITAMKIGALIALTILILPVVSRAQKAGMVLHLILNEGAGDVANDISGNGNNGALFGEPQWVEGKEGLGVHLDGVDDYIEIPGSVITAEATIEFWFKPDWDGTDAEDYRIFDASEGAIYFFISKGADHADINPEDFGFYFEDATDADWQDIEFPAAGVISAGEWHHFAVTWKFDGGSAFLYLNGEQVGTSPNILGGFPILSPNPRFGLETIQYIASRHGAGGAIDGIAIYNRQLSVDEINADIVDLLVAVQPSGKAATKWGSIKMAY